LYIVNRPDRIFIDPFERFEDLSPDILPYLLVAVRVESASHPERNLVTVVSEGGQHGCGAGAPVPGISS